MVPKPALGAHRFQITVTCVRQRILGRKYTTPYEKGGGAKTRIREMLSTASSSQIPNHDTTKKRCDISKQHSKQAKEREVVRKYKMFANSVYSL